MRVVVALGGNALLRRGDALTAEHQGENVAVACGHLAPVAMAHELVVSHGNGPQIGLLALEGVASPALPAFPLDVLGAETQGMIGYLIERELANRLPDDRPLATVLTMVEVDADDPAFDQPTKFIGPLYDAEEAAAYEREHGWTFRSDGGHLRRVVPSPVPRRIVEDRVIKGLLAAGCVVLCAGGGGIPTVRDAGGRLAGVEAVVDKDLAGGLLARDVAADVYVMATDVPAVYLGFGTTEQRAVREAHPDALEAAHAGEFPPGSMGPKVAAACAFARATGRPAVIGHLSDIERLVAGRAGTRITTDVTGVRAAAAGAKVH